MHENPYQSPAATLDGPPILGPEGRSPAVPSRGVISFEFMHNGHHVLLYITALCKGIVEVDGQRVFEERSFKLHDIWEVTVGTDVLRFDCRSYVLPTKLRWINIKGQVYINDQLVHHDIFGQGKHDAARTGGAIGGIVGAVGGYALVRYLMGIW